ncbi:DNA-binding MarR family transcriptional regulator [Rivibacter subsaxonicus]|uniref:DNA-binding MarR family transcriptional regulator n=2 Tax=Rivibacter subsaxonicus TaxID=457575 RepID=A0A4Q7W045_9BURK|nr:DNA-binding MarR family transcriptional regulator [Rivibacter subsaxonicus]
MQMDTSVKKKATRDGKLAVASPQGCTNLKLHQLGRRVARLYDAEVRALGLKGTQYSLLSYVVKLGPIQPGALAAAIGIAPSTLTRNLQPLQAQGWIVIEPGADARSLLVSATESGQALRAQAQRAWKRSQLELNARLGEERVVQLHALIDECLLQLDAAEAGESDEGEQDD